MTIYCFSHPKFPGTSADNIGVIAHDISDNKSYILSENFLPLDLARVRKDYDYKRNSVQKIKIDLDSLNYADLNKRDLDFI